MSPSPSGRSVAGLDLANVFMADVRDGVGVYLSVYLLTARGWAPAQVGWVAAIPGVVAIATQAHAGALLDDSRHKRLLLVLASVAVAVSCAMVLAWPTVGPVSASQVLIGLVGPLFQPAVSAISLGLVGHAAMRLRVGRNEGLNHAGNLLAALVAIGLGLWGSFPAIFGFALGQCVAMIGSVLLIRERDLDHDRARAAAVAHQPHRSFLRDAWALLGERDVAAFVAALTLWNVANGFLLPMLGMKLGVDDPRYAAVWLSSCIVVAQAVMVVVAPLAARIARSGRKRALLIAFLLIPLRAALFSVVDDRAGLVALQLFDGLGAGFYGVVGIVMMADLAKGTGRFNLLQGLAYALMGVGGAFSGLVGGHLIEAFGYDGAFLAFAAIGALATVFFAVAVREPTHADRLEPDPVDAPAVG
jgi:MFS family permease